MILDDIAIIPNLQFEAIKNWKGNSVKLSQTGFLRLVEENLSYNFLLWEKEDEARRDDLGFEFVYHAKRDIDKLNQSRNNYMEQMDSYLHQTLNPATTLPLHSETPGMMIDRLAILSLKIFHMGIQTKRKDVSENHRLSCQDKLSILIEQSNQLHTCLQEFIQDILNRKRTFKIYHQFKMYNDPTLNPALYAGSNAEIVQEG